ncbi:MAG: DM13 domain-containing protein [Lyngbya sp. HA4199-MV5]|jgi:hypothetical protein|nr:DM13 domain-containing protein [Lyngbya sp. HA4199-MV5]
MNCKGAIVLYIAVMMAGCTTQTAKQTTESPAASTPAEAAVPQASPSTQAQQSTASTAQRSGRFVSGEHETTGTARIVTANGKQTLELDQSFKTSTQGPDLFVILHRSDHVLKTTKPPAYPLQQQDYVVVSPLQKYSGAQQYTIPNTIQLANYKSVVIWCRSFNATFGVAQLNR